MCLNFWFCWTYNTYVNKRAIFRHCDRRECMMCYRVQSYEFKVYYMVRLSSVGLGTNIASRWTFLFGLRVVHSRSSCESDSHTVPSFVLQLAVGMAVGRRV